MNFRPSLLALEARWMPDGTTGDTLADPPPSTDPGVVGDGTGVTDPNGDVWYGDQDPPPGGGGDLGGGDPPPDGGGDLGGFLDDNPGAGGSGGPYVGP